MASDAKEVERSRKQDKQDKNPDVCTPYGPWGSFQLSVR